MSVDVEEVAVPGLVGRLDLGRVDYEDAFTMAVARPRHPEQLMRDMLEGAPPWFLHAWSQLLGKAVLGLRDGLDLSSSPDHVVGWQVIARKDDVFAIGLDTPRGLDARLFTVTTPTEEIVGTFIRLRTAYVRRLWPTIRAGHRFFLPYLLRRSANAAH
jgi:hypothetical protein